MPVVTAQDLRDIVADLIAPTIAIHRESASVQLERSDHIPRLGAPTDDEVDRFIATNPFLDAETHEQLLDPGLLGFDAKRAHATAAWLRSFRDKIRDWAATERWQAADDPWLEASIEHVPSETHLWIPHETRRPTWVSRYRSALLIAQQTIEDGRLLSELTWQQFEDLIAELLHRDGWTVSGLRRTNDGGIDVWANIALEDIGEVQSIWQAKKYGPHRKVHLYQVRELSGVLDRTRASKALVVTTSSLTRGALDWIRADRFRLGYHDATMLTDWIRSIPKHMT